MNKLSKGIVLLSCAVALPSSAATFTISYNGAPADAQIAIAHAASIWGSILDSPVPIKVLVNWFPMGATTLGITFPNGRRDFTGAPLPDTWYATALANSIAGVELNLGENDFDIWLNSDVVWSFDTTGTPAPGEYDLVSVALHEMGHGLGFVGLAKKVGAEGSFGMLEASDFAPLFTTFPWPELDTLPGIFDRYLAHAIDGPLCFMPNPGTQLGSAFTSQQIFFNGPIVMAENGGLAPRIHATTTFALGTSCVHLNESSYPPGNPNELMTPYAAPGHATHWPGPLCIAMLRDIGWVVTHVGISGPLATSTSFSVYPNPATSAITMNIPADGGEAAIEIADATGRVVMVGRGVSAIDVSGMADGPYTITCIRGMERSRARFVKE